MRTLIILALVSASMGGLYAAVTGTRTPSFRVTSLPPIVVTNIASGVGFVGGTDGVARTCPDESNVGVYVRLESKAFSNTFQGIDRKMQLISSPGKGFTIACLKVDLAK